MPAQHLVGTAAGKTDSASARIRHRRLHRCQHPKAAGEQANPARTPARLLLKIVRLAYVSLSMPVETVGAWCLQCRSYRGAEPPCVFVQTACGSTPTASQRWNFLQLSDSGNVDDGSVHIVHSSAGLCLASRCSATRNCSASHPTVFQHNQLEVTKCDATSLLQV